MADRFKPGDRVIYYRNTPGMASERILCEVVSTTMPPAFRQYSRRQKVRPLDGRPARWVGTFSISAASLIDDHLAAARALVARLDQYARAAAPNTRESRALAAIAEAGLALREALDVWYDARLYCAACGGLNPISPEEGLDHAPDCMAVAYDADVRAALEGTHV